MRRALTAEIEASLAAALGGAEELLPFARAVVLHLSGPPAGWGDEAEVAARVIAALESAIEPEGDVEEDPLAAVRDPALLASFFQNADLLAPKSPRTHRVARGVMAALDRIGAAS